MKTRVTKVLFNVGFVAVVLPCLVGCGTISNAISKATGDGRDRMNPVKIHVVEDSKGESENVGSASELRGTPVKTMADVERLPILNYYAALAGVQKEEAALPANAWDAQRRVAIGRYIDSGVVLVKTHCLRWFQRLNDDQRRLEYANSSTNVITELGTTLLGLGNANKYFVSTYGALNTTRAGLASSFNDSFLLAPNSKKVKAHIFSILDSEADKLSMLASDGKVVTFMDAYERLERYADLCTHSTAREITETALDQTTSTVDAKSKRISTVSIETFAAKEVADAKLKDELAKKSKDIDEKEKSITDIRADRDRFSQELVTAKKSLESSQIQGKALSSQLELLTQERAQLNQLIQDANRRMNQLTDELSRMKTQSDTSKAN